MNYGKHLWKTNRYCATSWSLYEYDSSEYDHLDVDAHGLFGYKYLDQYWTEPGRYPFLVRVEDKLAGLVLVLILNESEPKIRSIAELSFFETAAVSVAQVENNLPAQAFWRKVISEYT